MKSKKIENENCIIEFSDKISEISKIAAKITDGKVIGWFQGRMEWGPRALGNRSILILAKDMKEYYWSKESFRPFAPSMLREYVTDWFSKTMMFRL